jgi:predicted nucleic acid-binding protein
VTDVKVVDASALAALLFDEPEADFIQRALEGARLIAPHLIAFELANVCVTKTRREPGLRETHLARFRLRSQIAVEETPVDQAAVAELALSTGLTAYDASYLWLARELQADLVTLDRQLQRAAAGSL